MNRQGIRTDMNFLPTGEKVRTGKEIASQTKESQTQIYRYVRLTNCNREYQWSSSGNRTCPARPVFCGGYG